jgi:excisionase family DNA binding protein
MMVVVSLLAAGSLPNSLWSLRFVGGPMLRETWVTLDDVASQLGVAMDSVYRWLEQKRLPAHRVGRLWKFKLSEIDEWVHAGGAGDDTTAPGGKATR